MLSLIVEEIECNCRQVMFSLHKGTSGRDILGLEHWTGLHNLRKDVSALKGVQRFAKH